MMPVKEGRNGHGHSDIEGIYGIHVSCDGCLYGAALYLFAEQADGATETVLQRYLFQPDEVDIGIDPHA